MPAGLSLAVVFNKMEELKRNVDFDDYSLSQTTLDDVSSAAFCIILKYWLKILKVFIHFVSKQRDEEDTDGGKQNGRSIETGYEMEAVSVITSNGAVSDSNKQRYTLLKNPPDETIL